MYWTSQRGCAVGDDGEEQVSGGDLCSSAAGKAATGVRGYSPEEPGDGYAPQSFAGWCGPQ